MGKNILRSKEECQRILAEMREAAEVAAQGYMALRSDVGTCGFAEVMIAKNEFSLRRSKGSPFPRRLNYRGAMPSVLARCENYQSIDAAEVVATAMEQSLRGNGVVAFTRSWVD